MTDKKKMILDPGLNLSLRPMAYPKLFEMYKNGIKNTWTVDEVDFATDVNDIAKMKKPERHLINRLVAFFATGDSIVANNLVINLYKHINSPEARMYLSRQLYEEALHVQFYLTLLDTYVPEYEERTKAFSAIHHIPSIAKKADFCMRYMDKTAWIDTLDSKSKRRTFLLNLITYATAIEGLFFFAAFAYVYFLRDKGLLHGLATGTNWVFRDESMHMAFALEVVKIVREEEPDLFDHEMEQTIRFMLEEAVDGELQFAEDLLEHGISGLSLKDMTQYLHFVAGQRCDSLGMSHKYTKKNPLSFLDLQDVQELTNFFERRTSAYSVGVTGNVDLNAEF